MSDVRLILGDSLEVLPTLEADSVDSVCTDPPYGLEFMGKKWDRLGDVGKVSHSGPRQDTRTAASRHSVNYNGSSNVRCRKCSKWKWGHTPGDGGGGGLRCLCPEPDFPSPKPAQALLMQAWHQQWAEAVLRVLKPGAYLLAFGGTRTYHRLVCALEDAGFEIRDTLQWLYGSGFPKGKGNLKPSHEPIVLARKPGPRVLPLPGLEECRVGAESTIRHVSGERNGHALNCSEDGSLSSPRVNGSTSGRYPPNLLLCHSALCQRVGTKKVRGSHHNGETWQRNVGNGYREDWQEAGTQGQPYADADGLETVEDWLCADECPVRLLGEQSGHDKDRPARKALSGEGSGSGKLGSSNTYGDGRLYLARTGYQTECTAARFFPQFSWSAADDVPFLYCSKASRREREEGLEALPKQVATVGNYEAAGRDGANPRNYVGGEQARVEKGLPASEPRANHHPCVKPLALMRWLVRLITPPGGLCLDPFVGSGTTGVACLREGRRFIGVEQDEDYHAISLARVEHARQQLQQEAPLFGDLEHD